MKTLKPITLFLAAVMLICVTSYQVIGQSPSANAIISVAWSPDGNRIARVFANGTVEVINAVGGEIVFTYTSGLYVTDAAVAWNPVNSNQLAAGIERNVRIWNISTEQILFTLQAGSTDGIAYTEAGSTPEAILSLDWKADGSQLVSVSKGGYLRVWNTSSGVMTLDKSITQVVSTAWSPNGTQLIAGAGLSIITVNPTDGQGQQLSQNSLQPGSVTSIDWSPDGTKIVNGTVFGDVTIWNATTGERLHYFRDNNQLIREVKLSPDSGRVVSAGWDGAIRVWDTNSGEQLGVIPNSGRMFTVDWNPTGTQIVYGGEDTGGQSVMQIIAAPQLVSNGPLAFFSNRDGDWEIYSMNPDGTGLLKLTNNTVTDGNPNWSPDGRVFATQIRARRALPDG